MRWITGTALALLSFCANAQQYVDPPSDGNWWNPAESGRGYNIETQNNTMVVTYYAYDTVRAPLFFLSAGVWNGFSRSMTNSLIVFNGGQCIGCSYTNPTSQNLGEVQFTFTSDTRGQIRFPNGTVVPIERFFYTYDDPKQFLKGEWAVPWVELGFDFAEFIQLNRDCTSCTTPNAVEGRLILSAGFGRPVIAAPSVGSTFVAIVDSTPTFFDYYYFFKDSDEWTGFACSRLKTSPVPTLSQCQGLMFGRRMRTAASVAANPTSQPTASAKASLQVGEAKRVQLAASERIGASRPLPEEFAAMAGDAVPNSLRDDLLRLSE